MQPFSGMWMALLYLLPVGIFLTYKAMDDSQLFNKEFYYRMLKKLRNRNRREQHDSNPGLINYMPIRMDSIYIC